MTAKKILSAYGLWLAGVVSAAAALFFLYRSRSITWELEDELTADASQNSAGGLPDTLEEYLPAAEPVYGGDE